MLVRALALLWALLLAGVLHAATFTVINTGDSGPGSLRQAILDANATAGSDTIAFAIPAGSDPNCVPATGVCTITPTSNLPAITESVAVDGYTQTGATPNTNTVSSRQGLNAALRIALRGPATGGAGLQITAGNVVVQGLSIGGFFFGIDISLSGGESIAIAGNYIGTDVTGTTAVPNIAAGIRAGGPDGNVVIGGTDAAQRNLVSGNSGPGIFIYADVSATIRGNLVGTAASGLVALTNEGIGISATPDTSPIMIGGDDPDAGNVVTANGSYNISVTGSANHVIRGNLIGTNVTGTSALLALTTITPGVPRGGVLLRNASNSIIGGDTPQARNTISGNETGGVEVQNTVGTVGPGNNTVEGNYIGTDIGGTLDIGNTLWGVSVGLTPGTDIIDNVIAFSKAGSLAGTGVGIVVGSGSGQALRRNAIHSNAGLGIELVVGGAFDGVTANDAGDGDTGANNLQNFPVITSVVITPGNATIGGTLNSRVAGDFQIDFFANAACDASGNGEGQTYIGTIDVLTDGAGNVNFGPVTFPVPAGQTIITATATDLETNDTSEFSACSSAGAGGTSTALVSSLNPSVIGQAVTFTATVTGSSPTGTVQFREGATALGTVALSGNQATLTTNSLAVGAHPVTAVYSGDADDLTSTSPVVSQVVTPIGLPPTTTVVVSSLNPSLFGQAVTFTATVDTGGFNATGPIQFRDGTTLLATISPANNMASFTTSALAVGTHAITATYTGDEESAPSMSPALIQSVLPVVVPPPGAPLEPIPTLSEWTTIVLSILLVLAGAHALQRRRPAGR